MGKVAARLPQPSERLIADNLVGKTVANLQPSLQPGSLVILHGDLCLFQPSTHIFPSILTAVLLQSLSLYSSRAEITFLCHSLSVAAI